MNAIGAVLAIASWQVRRGWRSLVVLALVVALTAGFVMTAATGARRADTAFDQILVTIVAAGVT